VIDNIVIDTNVVIRYFGDYSKLTSLAETAVDDASATGAVFVPSIVIVEMIYLFEKKRIPFDVLSKLREALDDDSTAFALVELTREIADEIENIDRSIVADMPDRIIAATAKHLGVPLVTSEEIYKS
jgi:predicted nucleic acid-binding protein